MKTVYILFGEMGSGKNYHGEKLSMNMGVEFLDGDTLLPEEMIERVSTFKPLSPEMIDNYITNHLAPAILNRSELVLAQALYMDKHRLFLRDFLEDQGYTVVFYWVKPKFWNNLKQIYSRPKGFKWVLYWLMNKPFFQKPSHDHQIF